MKSITKGPVSSCSLFLALFALPLAAPPGCAATLRGTVLDPQGRAVSGAQVTLLNPIATLEQTRSDAHGEYSFTHLPAGDYQLLATLPGFSTALEAAKLKADSMATIDLRLRLSAVEQRVVVSASLAGALAPQIGSSVSVISRQEMEEQGTPTVLDALRQVPGVTVNQSGRWGGVTGVFLRGGNSNYNLVTIDGIEVNQFGGDFDFAPLLVDGLDRVEVVRGPQSALYGSNAVTGAINLVTTRGDGPWHVSLLEEAGSFGTWHIGTEASGLSHGVGWSVEASRLDSAGVVANDSYRDQSAILTLDRTASPRHQFTFHFFGNANNAGAPGPFGSDPDHLFPGLDPISRDKQNLLAGAVRDAEQLSDRVRQISTVSLATNDYYFRSPFGDSFSNNLRLDFNTRTEWQASNTHLAVAGFEYNREQIRNTFIDGAGGQPFLLPRASLAWFGEDRWNPGRRWFLSAGARLDDIRTASLPPDGAGFRPLVPANSVVQANPRLSAAYLARSGGQQGLWGATRIHSSFGTGIRAPDGFELAFTNNPHLKPERSLSFDVGVEQRFFGERAVLDATYFLNRFRDQIVVLGGSLTNLSTFTSDNLARSRARGLELSFRVRPTRSLSLAAEYTRLDTALLALNGSDLVPAPFTVGQPLLRRPRDSGSYSVTWRRGRLALATEGYVRGKELDLEPNLGTFACTLGLTCLFDARGYVRADAGFSYRVAPGLEFYGKVNNLLDRKYEESLGFPALHTNFAAGMRLNFPSE